MDIKKATKIKKIYLLYFKLNLYIFRTKSLVKTVFFYTLLEISSSAVKYNCENKSKHEINFLYSWVKKSIKETKHLFKSVLDLCYSTCDLRNTNVFTHVYVTHEYVTVKICHSIISCEIHKKWTNTDMEEYSQFLFKDTIVFPFITLSI